MRTDGQTDMTKQIVAFRNSANASKNCNKSAVRHSDYCLAHLGTSTVLTISRVYSISYEVSTSVSTLSILHDVIRSVDVTVSTYLQSHTKNQCLPAFLKLMHTAKRIIGSAVSRHVIYFASGSALKGKFTSLPSAVLLMWPSLVAILVSRAEPYLIYRPL